MRKKYKMKGDLSWIRGFERARARHELAHLGIGTIFLVKLTDTIKQTFLVAPHTDIVQLAPPSSYD